FIVDQQEMNLDQLHTSSKIVSVVVLAVILKIRIWVIVCITTQGSITIR
ncbi:MAG: hypothetical protein K0S80_5293, partial [Neobacillus sp.]|nr:hypothetical protein [Neobacillus sp.]